jgi:hypothetical protein
MGFKICDFGNRVIETGKEMKKWSLQNKKTCRAMDLSCGLCPKLTVFMYWAVGQLELKQRTTAAVSNRTPHMGQNSLSIRYAVLLEKDM